jgi:hypothetical protein
MQPHVGYFAGHMTGHSTQEKSPRQQARTLGFRTLLIFSDGSFGLLTETAQPALASVGVLGLYVPYGDPYIALI